MNLPDPGVTTPPTDEQRVTGASAKLSAYVIPIRCMSHAEAIVMASSAKDALDRFMQGESESLSGKEYGVEQYGRVRRATDWETR